MRNAAFAAAILGGGVALGTAAARADCAWDIQMAVAEIADVEGAIPLSDNPDLPLGPGVELPPQSRSTKGEAGENRPEGLVSGATPSGQEVVPDAEALTGQSMEGSVPGPAEETVAASVDPAAGLIDAPSSGNAAAGHLARAKLKVRDAQNAVDRGDEEACFAEIDQAKDLVSQARAAVITAATGKAPPAPTDLPSAKTDEPDAGTGSDQPVADEAATDAAGSAQADQTGNGQPASGQAAPGQSAN